VRELEKQNGNRGMGFGLELGFGQKKASWKMEFG